MPGTGHSDDQKCSTRLIINWLGIIAILALGSAVGLSVHDRNDATTIVTIVGISASVASGLIGYLGGRAATQQQSTGTGPIINTTEPPPAPTPAPEDPA